MNTIRLLFFLSEERMRRLPDLAKVLLLFLFPIMCVIGVDLLWYYVMRVYVVVPYEDKDTILSMLTGVSVLYSIVAGAALKRVWKEQDTTQDLCCLVEEGKDKYVSLLVTVIDRRIPLVTHVLLIMTSVVILFFILICPYKAGWVGLCVISAATFIMTTGWSIAIELENPLSGYWIVRMSTKVQNKIHEHRRKF